MPPSHLRPAAAAKGERGAVGGQLAGGHLYHTPKLAVAPRLKVRELLNDDGHFVGLEVARV
jgi:hypothetical protein